MLADDDDIVLNKTPSNDDSKSYTLFRKAITIVKYWEFSILFLTIVFMYNSGASDGETLSNYLRIICPGESESFYFSLFENIFFTDLFYLLGAAIISIVISKLHAKETHKINNYIYAKLFHFFVALLLPFWLFVINGIVIISKIALLKYLAKKS